MPLRLAAVAALAIAVAMLQAPLSSQAGRGGRRPSTTWIDGREAVDGEVIVGYRSGTGRIERERAEFQSDADEVEPIGRRGARRMRSRLLSTEALLQALRANPDVEFVEPNYIVSVGAVPNEPWFVFLWGLLNSGQLINGTNGIPGADISAPQAWDVSTGSRATVVGVIDSGIDYSHPDLAANIWTAPRDFTVVISGVQITCAAGTHGFNAINNTCNPMDDHSHGTHVAGTIGAVGNNGFGIAGVNWTASMMGLKFLGSSGSGSTSDAIKSIEFAMQAKAVLGADANVRILSNSWGGGGFSQALKNQVDAANTADMLFVAAAGNSASNNDTTPFYPSSFASDNLVSVAATTNRDQLASFSNWGLNSVDLGAPGQTILSTVPGNNYAYFSGTSMAAPHVSGAAALVLAVCQRSTAELKSMLLTSVDPIAALSGITATGGRLNVNEALAGCSVDPPTLGISGAGTTITVTVANAPGNPRDWLALYCPSTNADATFRAWKYLNNSAVPPANGLESATVTFAAPPGGGTCNARLFVDNGWNKVATSPDLAVVVNPPSILVTNGNVNPGASMNIVVADGPANTTDWIGLFAANAPDSPPLKWSYLNGSTTPPASGLAAANVSMTAPAASGTYNLRLFASNSYTRLATSNTVTVAPPLQPSVTLLTPSVAPGGVIQFAIANGPGTATDWVALHPASAADNTYVDWMYLSGTRVAPAAGLSNATLQFAAPATPGTYNVRFFHQNGYTKLATSANATVTPPSAPSVTATNTVAPGGTIEITVTNGPASPTDWIALSATGADDQTFLHWVYLNGTRTPPATGMGTATMQIAAPTVPGSYNVRLFASNSYTKLATSGTITVDGPGPPVPQVTAPASVAAGGTITVLVQDGPANVTDWVAFYSSGSADQTFLDWMYLSGTRVAPAAGQSSASLTFTAPSTPGTYQFRFFASNSYTRLATSAIVTVTP